MMTYDIICLQEVKGSDESLKICWAVCPVVGAWVRLWMTRRKEVALFSFTLLFVDTSRMLHTKYLVKAEVTHLGLQVMRTQC